MRVGLLLLLSLAVGTVPAPAQTSVAGPLPSLVWSRAERGPLQATRALAPSDTVPRNIQPTYWKEGALIGGVAGAVAGALLFAAFCESSDVAGSCAGSTVGGVLVGALILGLPGALIGGQFPKGGSADSLPE